MSDWQTIESAPKDGTWILLFVTEPAGSDYAIATGEPEGWSHIDVGRWHDDVGEFERVHAGEPTHWMPLPPPPKK